MILDTRTKTYVTGDPVTAELINDVVDTTVAANANAKSAVNTADEAKSTANNAKATAEQAMAELDDAQEALAIAKEKYAIGLQDANKFAAELQSKVDNKAFDGKDGVVVPIAGAFCFQVEGDELYLYCADENTAPATEINANGELILTFPDAPVIP